MSKQWVSREDYIESSELAVDPGRLVEAFLPKLRAHVTKRYAWLDTRGNCMLSIDDVIQAASIRLIQLAERWAVVVDKHPEWEPTDGTYDALFFTYLHFEVKKAIGKEHQLAGGDTSLVSLTVEQGGEQFERAALYEYSDGELHDRTGVRRRPDGPWWHAVVEEIMTFWDTMAPKEKMSIALRHYDELPADRVATLMGTSPLYTNRVERRWRAHARNTVRLGDDYEFVPRTKPYAWQPTDLLEAYLQDRHQKTLHEYLGVVTISFRVDPDYLVRALTAANTYSPSTHDKLSANQLDALYHLADEGLGYAAIARELNVTDRTVARRLQRA